MRWFRGAGETESKPVTKVSAGQRIGRRSTGFTEFTRALASYSELSVLDLGPTSSSNIAFLTGFGGRVYNEDLLRATQDPQYRQKSEGIETLDVDRFFVENLDHPENRFDAVLCWDTPDYLHEALVKPMVQRIHKIMKPGGILLAFFHTRDAGPDCPYYRYHIAKPDLLELERGPDFKLQRVFNNRHV